MALRPPVAQGLPFRGTGAMAGEQLRHSNEYCTLLGMRRKEYRKLFIARSGVCGGAISPYAFARHHSTAFTAGNESVSRQRVSYRRCRDGTMQGVLLP